jgi:homoserine dehydrogenase
LWCGVLKSSQWICRGRATGRDAVRHVTLVQLGIGTVGGAVVEQVLAHRDRWRRDLGVDLRVGAVVTRAGAVVSASGTHLPDEVLAGMVRGRRAGTTDAALTGAPIDVVAPVPAVDRLADAGPVVVADCAAGEDGVPALLAALSAGGGVALANKAPLALPWDDAASRALWDEAGPGGRVRYEATCGAGLPVISTLRTLLDTGDEVLGIQGTVSGTFGTIFSSVADGQSFGDAVRDAAARGYTEPDPRDDLSGLDVARKALILARTLGQQRDLADMAVESLVPAALASSDVDVPAFLRRIGELDGEIARRAGLAATEDATLKYLCEVDPTDGPSVGVRAVPRRGVLGALQGPENIVVLRTRRYDAYPLAVSGPGAGAEVTAAGVLADVLALAPVIA